MGAGLGPMGVPVFSTYTGNMDSLTMMVHVFRVMEKNMDGLILPAIILLGSCAIMVRMCRQAPFT